MINRKFDFIIASILLGVTTNSSVAVNATSPVEKYSQTPYEVVSRLDREIEVRRYNPRVVARVEVSGEEKNAAREGIQILTAYIYGKNKKHEPIELIAPVAIQHHTATTQSDEASDNGSAPTRMAVSFFMPRRFSLSNLPEPQDNRIKLVELPQERVAAIRFSGNWRPSNFAKHEQELRNCLEKKNMKPTASPINAYYNLPFIPAFMRHNEVLIRLAD
jgi:hypothetical protein